MEVSQIEPGHVTIKGNALADTAVAIWRIQRRINRELGTPEPVRLACERAIDSLHLMEIRLDEMMNKDYDENLKVIVVDYESAEGKPHISECLSPAVYLKNQLIQQAQVIVRGEVRGTSDR